MDKALFPTRKIKLARALRRDATRNERQIWLHLRGRRVSGLKFRRQCAIGPFIADFACLEAKLVIEIDGPSHDHRHAYDAARTAFLEKRGFRVMRFTVCEVSTDFLPILESIEKVALERKLKS